MNAKKKAKLIERWQNVLRVLENLSPHERRNHWDMATFGMQTDCGTVACAAGHCSLDPWFRRRGFAAEFDDGELNPTRDREWPDMVEGFFGVPINSFDSLGPDPDRTSLEYQGVRIFYNMNQRPVSQVIKEIRAFICMLERA